MSILATVNLDYTTEKPDAVTGARPLTPESSSSVLNKIIDRCKDRIVIFDLDSTLLDNRARNATIMKEFGENQNQPTLKTAKPQHWQDWSARNAMAAMGLPVQDIDKLVDSYTTFWSERFFTSHYCQYDTEVAGAGDFVRELQQSGSVVRYLTGRHEEMRSGTESSLVKLGFPAPGSDDVALIMKPEQSIPDDDYKKNAMVRPDLEAGILAAFDNEPYHINAYRDTFTDATCVHLHTDHSMRSVRLLGGIVSIVNFIR